MTVLVEEDLQITLPEGITARKFDDRANHGLSHCMQAVDFIVEQGDRMLFIEFKDPESPCGATQGPEPVSGEIPERRPR